MPTTHRDVYEEEKRNTKHRKFFVTTPRKLIDKTLQVKMQTMFEFSKFLLTIDSASPCSTLTLDPQVEGPTA